MERNTKKTEHRMRQRSLSRPEAWQTLNFGPETTNGDFEDEDREDVSNQSSQMFSILREESIIPPFSSPALSSSTVKSPPIPRTPRPRPGPASKTGRKKAGPRSIIGSPTVTRKSLRVHKSDSSSLSSSSTASRRISRALETVKAPTGEKPFECKICQFAFTNKANCERHLKNMHGRLTRESIQERLIIRENLTAEELNC